MPPSMGAPPQQQASAGLDVDTLVNAIVGPLMARIDSLEARVASMDALHAYTLRAQYQRAGEYTAASILAEFGVEVPQ